MVASGFSRVEGDYAGADGGQDDDVQVGVFREALEGGVDYEVSEAVEGAEDLYASVCGADECLFEALADFV